MENVVTLTLKEIESLFDYATKYKDGLGKYDVVVVTQTNSSGIGVTTKAFISTSDTDSDEGIYKDITDYDTW